MTLDTIYALASGRPPAGVAVIRVSGPKAHRAGHRLAGHVPNPRQALLRTLRNEQGETLDHALVLRFDMPASFTGEDVIEFHCHGGRAVVDGVLRALRGMGLREARPGEFTRRAFDNGRIDLTEAEGLADLIEAETESQRRAALAMAEGGLRRQIEGWQARLLDLAAQAEGAIDYVGDDDFQPHEELADDCEALASELQQWLCRPRVEPLKEGIRVVVAGPPNAGKSSLINAIVGSDRVIVTDIPGTTRDQVDVPLAIAGTPILLTDTAGLRGSDDPVERLGIDRAKSLIGQADVILWLGDENDIPNHPRIIRIFPRCDQEDRRVAPEGYHPTSAHTGAGISQLMEMVAINAASLLPALDEVAINRRQAACLQWAANALIRASSCQDPILIAEELRAARAAFADLTGNAGIEGMLDALFSRFCLGK